MKNKVVIVNKDFGARIHVTTDPDSIVAQPGEVRLVNPITKLVDSLPPELWAWDGEKLVPVVEDGEVKKRILTISTLPKIHQVAREHQIELLDTVKDIKEIKSQVLDVQDMLDELLALAVHGVETRQKMYKMVLVAIIISTMLLLIGERI